MAIDERARHELHRKLEEILGAEEAATLMAHLPPVGWADVSTKHDLAQLREYIDLRFQSMEDRFDGKLDKLEGRLYERMADFAATITRTTVISVVGSVVSVGGLVFAARLV
jgi:hypothetical protein